LKPLLADAAKFTQVLCTLRAFEYVEVLHIAKVESLWSLYESAEGVVIHASDALGIWIVLEHVLL
jgi:hypothetical protein